MNGIFLFFVNKHLSSWPLLGFFTDNRILALSKLKAFVDKNFTLAKMVKLFYDRMVGLFGFNASTNTTFFPKPPATFLSCFSRGERQKYAGKKVGLKWVSKSQPSGHESNTLTTEPPGRGSTIGKR